MTDSLPDGDAPDPRSAGGPHLDQNRDRGKPQASSDYAEHAVSRQARSSAFAVNNAFLEKGSRPAIFFKFQKGIRDK